MRMPNSNMDEQPQPSQDSPKAPERPSPVQVSEPITPPPEQIATEHHLDKVGRDMNSFERSTLRWTKANFYILAITCLFIGSQWFVMRQTLGEMRSSGAAATNQLWQAIGNMNWMARTADGSLKQAQHTLDATLKESDSENKRTVGMMHQQLEITDRAWLRVEVSGNRDLPPNAIFPTTLSFDTNGRGNLGRTVILHNVGRSVATHVRIRDTTVVGDPESAVDIKLPLRRQQEFCARPLSPNASSFTIFPDVPFKSYEASVFETKAIPDPPEITRLQRGKPVALYLVGCVDYVYGSAGTKHETGFALEVFGGTNHEGIQIKGSYSPESLTFLPFFLGGDYAY